MRNQLGEQKLATWLAALVAGGVKDRMACELLTLVDFDRESTSKAESWASLPDQVLARNALDPTVTKADRVLALWLLAGTHRYPSQTLPRRHKPSWHGLLHVMASKRLPLALAYCLQPLARHSAGLLIPLLLIDQMLRDNPGCQERQQPLPETMQLQGVTSAAYDMHTSEDCGAVAGSSSSECHSTCGVLSAAARAEIVSLEA
jgi:hypothetical protein